MSAKQSLEVYLQENVDSLFQSLGRFDSRIIPAEAIEDDEAERRGKERLEVVISLCRSEICRIWSENRSKSDLEIAGALYDLFALCFQAPAVGMISALLIRRGLDRLCESGDHDN